MHAMSNRRLIRTVPRLLYVGLLVTAASMGIPRSALAQNAVVTPIITTVAGNGTQGYNGDNIAAINADLQIPFGVAIDASGAIYIADYGNNRIRKVTPNGTITTVAGNGTAGYNGDNIAATSAELSGPVTVAIDSAGAIYIADEGNSRIRKVTPDGIITTVAGNGVYGYNGDNISATNAEISAYGVAVDGTGNVYIGDWLNNRIRKVTQNGLITTIAGNGMAGYNGDNIAAPTAELNGPTGLAVDVAGDIYIADTTNQRIRKVTPGGTITTVAGNGAKGYNGDDIAATSAEVFNPATVAIDGIGDLYIADSNNARLRKVTTDGIISTVAGNGSFGYNGDNIPAANASVAPFGVALDASGNIYMADNGNSRIRKVSTNSDLGSVNVASSSFVVPITFTFTAAARLGSISVLTQGATGLDFSDAGSDTCIANASFNSGQTCTVNVTFTPRFAGLRMGAVVLQDSNSNVLGTGYVHGIGVGPQVSFLPGTESVIPSSGLAGPIGIAVDGGGSVYISDNQNQRVVRLAYSNGSYTQSTMTTGLSNPNLIAVDGAGAVYIADVGNMRVVKEAPTAGGYAESTVDSNFGFPYGVAVDGSGNVYIADSGNGQILEETLSAGTYTRTTAVSGLTSPSAVAVDGSGNLYIAVANNGNGAILKETWSASGYAQSALPVTGQIAPQSIALDGTGSVYFEDASTDNIYKETSTAGGYVETLAVGDLHTPVGPWGIVVDGSGNLYIAFTGKNQIVKADFADPPSLTFASTPVGLTSSDSPQTVTVENIGNADLTLPIPASGNDPSIDANFTLDDNAASACPVVAGGATDPGTLAAGASCNLAISFTPQSVGAISGSLVLTDNNLNTAGPGYAQRTIALSGTSTSAAATMTSPTPGSTLSGSNVTFTWNTAPTATYYSVWVGTTGPGSNDVDYPQAIASPSTSMNFTNIPTNAQTLYVRLWSYINSQWQYNDYTYTASGAAVGATMTSPTPGSTLPGATVTFHWTAATNATYYSVWLGTTGVGSNDVDYPQAITAANTSMTFSNLPTNAQTVYARLWWYVNNQWQYNDYTYKASGAPVGATMTSPAPGSTLPGATVTFHWTAATNATYYSVWLGTTGVGSNNVDYPQAITAANTSMTFSKLPTNAQTIYTRLWWYVNNQWQYTDYTYTASGSPMPAAMISPAPGSTLPGSTVTFTWSPATNATYYSVWVGTMGPGSNDVDYPPAVTSPTTSMMFSNLPTAGQTLYVRLWSYINNQWQYTDYTYTAF